MSVCEVKFERTFLGVEFDREDEEFVALVEDYLHPLMTRLVHVLNGDFAVNVHIVQVWDVPDGALVEAKVELFSNYASEEDLSTLLEENIRLVKANNYLDDFYGELAA